MGAHGGILRVQSKEPQLADHIVANPWGAPLEPRQRAIVDLALVLATRSAELAEADLDAARTAGCPTRRSGHRRDHRAVRDGSNRLAHLMALRPNDEFFRLGRT